MSENKKDMQPILRIEGENGTAWYPRFHKNEKGEWELNDKSFQKMFKSHSVLEKTDKTEKD